MGSEFVENIKNNEMENEVFFAPNIAMNDSFDLKLIQRVAKIERNYLKKTANENEDNENVIHSMSKSEHTRTPLIERILLKTPKSSISDQSSTSNMSSVSKSLKRNLNALFCDVDDEITGTSPIKKKKQKIESRDTDF